MPALFFDEFVHLAVIGNGFLRTPFLHATNPLPDRPAPSSCQTLDGSVIHIPAAHRQSGLTLHDPAFRRAVITSTLAQRLSYDQALQSNQEGAGLAAKFHVEPHRNLARVFTNDLTTFAGDQALILDSHPDAASLIRPEDVNVLGTAAGDQALMPTGFMAFLSRSWAHQRHIDAEAMLRPSLPLQFDLDWNVIWQMGNIPGGATFQIPIWGNSGDVKVWDARLGPETYDVLGSPILGVGGAGDTSGGTIKVIQDAQGGFYLDGSIVETPTDTIPIVIQDDAGAIYSRNIAVVSAYPTPPTLILPSGRVGTPFLISLPPESGFFHYVGHSLPSGLVFDTTTHQIHGTPEVYGANFSVRAEVIDLTGQSAPLTFYFAVNRSPRVLLSFFDTEGNDHHTGEVYDCRFMPYGTMLVHAGTAYEFRRGRSTTQWWPGVATVPYVYGHAGRRSGIDVETYWRNTGAVTVSP